MIVCEIKLCCMYASLGELICKYPQRMTMIMTNMEFTYVFASYDLKHIEFQQCLQNVNVFTGCARVVTFVVA